MVYFECLETIQCSFRGKQCVVNHLIRRQWNNVFNLKTPNAILARPAWPEGLLFQYKALKEENTKQKRAG